MENEIKENGGIPKDFNPFELEKKPHEGKHREAKEPEKARRHWAFDVIEILFLGFALFLLYWMVTSPHWQQGYVCDRYGPTLDRLQNGTWCVVDCKQTIPHYDFNFTVPSSLNQS